MLGALEIPCKIEFSADLNLIEFSLNESEIQ